MKWVVQGAGGSRVVEVERRRDGFDVTVDGEKRWVDLICLDRSAASLRYPEDGRSFHVTFQRNGRRMQYQECHEEGYPTGSGTVESGCKQLVGMRMKGPGMRWSRPGAENMLALRTEYLIDK